MNKQEAHIVTGLSRDITINRFNPNMVYDAHNIRITARDGKGTLLSVTNEKGTQEITLPSGFDDIKATVIGYAVLNNNLILFSHADLHNDYIHKITFDDNGGAKVTLLFEGNAGFDHNTLLETLPLYENENIQKVYWVDGIHQPRVININGEKQTNADVFNFSRKINLEHSIDVTKRNSGGKFPAGTVQYAFSYYNKFAQQTRIFDYTPLYYLCPKDRGLAADTNSSCSFEIKVTNADKNFDFLRVYSIVRSSANATPSCRLVGDYPTGKNNESVIKIGNSSTEVGTDTEYNGSIDNLYVYNPIIGLRTPVSDFPTISENYPTITKSLDLYNNYLIDTVNKKAYKSDEEAEIGLQISDSKYSFKQLSTDTNFSLDSYDYTEEEIGNTVVIIDNGVIGESVDAKSLPLVGGEPIVASTLAQKDNTLFLGNIKEDIPNVGTLKVSGTDLKDYIRNTITDKSNSKDEIFHIAVNYDAGIRSKIDDGKSLYDTIKNDHHFKWGASGKGFYNYNPDNNRSSQQLKKFKYGESYRLGFIAQYDNGQWSEAIWLDDVFNYYRPYTDSNGYFATGAFAAKLDANVVNSLLNAGFKRIAPVIVYPTMPDRHSICQGIVSPTVYNVGDRAENGPFVQSSWYFRMFNDSAHGHSLSNIFTRRAEIENLLDWGMATPYAKYYKVDDDATAHTLSIFSKDDYIDNFKEDFFIDSSTLTFNSPDVENSGELQQSDLADCSMRIVGLSEVNAVKNDNFLQVSSIGVNPDKSREIDVDNRYAAPMYADGMLDLAYARKTNNDVVIGDYIDARNKDRDDNNRPYEIIAGWNVYPWNRYGSLSGQGVLTTKQESKGYKRTAMLSRKIFSELFYGINRGDFIDSSIVDTEDFVKKADIAIGEPKLFNSTDMTAIRLADTGIYDVITAPIYYGNIDKVLTLNNKNLSMYKICGLVTSEVTDPVNSSSTTKYSKYVMSSSYDDAVKGIDKSLGYPITYSWRKVYGDYTDNTNIKKSNCNRSYEELSKASLLSSRGRLYDNTNFHMYFADSTHQNWRIEGMKSSPYILHIGKPGTLSNSDGKNYYDSPDSDTVTTGLSNKEWGYWGTDPIQMKYKSVPHLVFSLQKGSAVYPILPCSNYDVLALALNDSPEDNLASSTYLYTLYKQEAHPFWETSVSFGGLIPPLKPLDIHTTLASEIQRSDTAYEDMTSFQSSNLTYRGVLIADLFRTFTDEEEKARFGGSTQEAISTNIWTKCGDAVLLKRDDSAIIEYLEGDIYIGRYDCLKTYPYTEQDTNSIVEIFSAEIESRVNLDCRYDKNIGLASNIAVRPTNFNLFNHAAYEQENNFFTYSSIDYDRFVEPSFPNMVTFSTEKILGEDVDTWASIDLTSTVDLDGDKGEVVALKNFNNEIYSFQRKGLAQLLFNSRVQIPASDGMPIEITNGLKMQGKRYISSMIGVQNKFAIAESPAALYFIDNNLNTLYAFNGQQCKDISTEKGMSSWLQTNNYAREYTLNGLNSFILSYDKTNQDLYIANNDECLVYSETMGQFISFMDYQLKGNGYFLYPMVNIGDSFYAITSLYNSANPIKIYKMFAGQYNDFFGTSKGYSLTFASNDNPTMDKTFNNVEFRTNMWDGSAFLSTGQLMIKPLDTFSNISVSTENQTGSAELITADTGDISNLKKKFNVWRATIPRDADERRIRNPWCLITLSMSDERASNHDKLQFMDMIVDYTM